jgi:hypothetical protein
MTLTTRKNETLIKTLQEVISFAEELKTWRFTDRKLGGVEQLEYFRLIKCLEQAKGLVVELRRDNGN